MPNLIRKAAPWKSPDSVEWNATEGWNYPTGMVWCPMKKSGMAILKCAKLQKELGCGSLREFKIIASAKTRNVPFRWPWLRRGQDCPERAPDKEVRELRLAVSSLKSVEKSRKNPRSYRCPACGGSKAFGARRCRRCWRLGAG